MEQSKVMATTDKPKNITHESYMLYCSLKQCMENNAELRQALTEAAATIDKLTEALNECHS